MFMFPLAAPLTPPQQNTPLSLWKGHCSPHSWQNSNSTVPFTTVSPRPPAPGAEPGVWHQPQKEAWKWLYFESVNKQIIQWCSNTSLAWFSSNFSLKNIQKNPPNKPMLSLPTLIRHITDLTREWLQIWMFLIHMANQRIILIFDP